MKGETAMDLYDYSYDTEQAIKRFCSVPENRAKLASQGGRMKITVEIDETKVAYALEAAGSAYWANLPKGPMVVFLHTVGEPEKPVISTPFFLDELIDERSGEKVRHRVCSADIKRGLQLMAEKYPKHFADLVSEEGDMWTGDVLLQLSTLGELKYA